MSEEKKQHPAKMGVTIIKAREAAKDTRPVSKAETGTQIDKDDGTNAGDWISPPIDQRGLKIMVNQSTILPQCTRAYKNNIPGFGIGVRYKDDVDETPEMEAEYTRMEELIELLSLDQDTKEVFEDIIEARETYGIAYLEVIRNVGGEVSQIEFVRDVPSVRKTRQLEPYIETVFYYKGREEVRKRKFRKYKQTSGGKTVYFKEFGDKRIMDKRSGDYVDELEIEYQANEIIEFAIGTEPYGEVRWLGQILTVDGARKAEFLNNNYFENGRHTPLMIMVEGGTLSDASYAKLQQYMDDIKGVAGQHAFILLETEAADNKVDFENTQQPKVEVKDLASILQKDELFQDYLDNGRRKVQSAFQLPDLYVGYTTDFNRATAQTAMEVTEKQVFQPERKSLAWAINNRLFNEFGFQHVEAYFMEPDISNPDDLAKILTICNVAGGLTPNKAKQIALEALGEVSEDFPDEWGEIPLAVQKTQQASAQPSMDGLFAQAIQKAEHSRDDDIVPVLKEIRRVLRKNFFTELDGQGIIKYNEDQPRDEDGKFAAGDSGAAEADGGEESGPSPSGANTFKVQGFRSEKALSEHYDKHGEEYKDDDRVKSKKDFKKVALDLVQAATGGDIMGHIDKSGYVIRYDKAHNDYVKGNPEKGIFTMFKPTDGQAYYDGMREEDVKRGGRA